MKIILAPMDGITDFHVRQLLTAIGGFDLCISEFLRVSKSVFPKRVFYQNCPEINPLTYQHLDLDKQAIHQLKSKTLSATPVHIQLLGSDPDYMAANAAKAVALGALGIDINFGCPAKTVNGHGGGAVLLQKPKLLFKLVNSMRKAVPKHIPISAKMRLGYEDSSLLLDNALAIEDAGADFVTIHARTKKDGYRPPAKWHEVKPLLNQLKIPIVINGEIWNTDDYQQCKIDSGIGDIMLGRGAFSQPDLALQIKSSLGKKKHPKMQWQDILNLLCQFYLTMQSSQLVSPKYIAGRLKLWIKWLMASYDEAVVLFEQIKKLKNSQEIYQLICKQINDFSRITAYTV